MTEISFRLEGYRINLRVGGIFIDEGRVLMNRLERDDSFRPAVLAVRLRSLPPSFEHIVSRD